MPSIENRSERYHLEAQDLVLGVGALLFALFSVIWPDTGMSSLLGRAAPRGYPVAVAFLAIALISLVIAPRIEARSSNPFLLFLRRFYPQAFCAAFFTESILLSSRAMDGFSHDAFFAAADQALFGFQPSVEFSRALGMHSWVNEIMFGAYFVYFALLTVTPWIAWLKGYKGEAARQIYVFTTVFILVDIFYVFFRVQGPKYWFPELNAAWYDHFEGGFFVVFFQRLFANTTLSGAAFPSTHVMLTFLTLSFARRLDRRLFAAYLPISILIILSTVYIYAHYAVDAAGGALFAIILSRIAEVARPSLEGLCRRRGIAAQAQATR
jgi:membrane-associated phospholipid phosphatase